MLHLDEASEAPHIAYSVLLVRGVFLADRHKDRQTARLATFLKVFCIDSSYAYSTVPVYVYERAESFKLKLEVPYDIPKLAEELIRTTGFSSSKYLRSNISGLRVQ